jgi:glycosyltransferase involved in cell wall biosynthesis
MLIIICNYFPPTIGGTERHISTQVKYISKRGIPATVIVKRPPFKDFIQKNYDQNIINTILKEKIFLQEFPEVPIYNLNVNGIASVLKLRRIIRMIMKEHNIKLIDLHAMSYTIGLPSRIKKILSLHFYEPICPYAGFPQKIMQDHFTLNIEKVGFSLSKCVFQNKCVSFQKYIEWRICRENAIKTIEKIVVKTDYFRKILIQGGVPEERIVLIPYWIDVDKILLESRDDELRAQCHNSADLIFGFVGRLDFAKGIKILLPAFNYLIKYNKNAKLIIIGDGPLRSWVEEYVNKNNLQKSIMLMGYVPLDKIYKYFSLPDVFVHTQLFSNYGWALLESMATGKPIIATDVGETRDILIDEYNALLSPPEPKALAYKMIKIMEDKKLALKLGANALTTIKEKHSLNNLEKYYHLIKNLSS